MPASKGRATTKKTKAPISAENAEKARIIREGEEAKAKYEAALEKLRKMHIGFSLGGRRKSTLRKRRSNRRNYTRKH